jgi:hypothetical protein
MMKKLLAIIGLAFLAVLLAGCMPKSFIDPGMYKGGLKTAPKVDKPIPVSLSVTGLTNGSENNRATEFWNRQFTKSLNDAQVLIPASGGESPRGNLSIQMDNVGDIGNAAGKGFMTGLTLGLVGSTVTDGYVMKSTYTSGDGRKNEREYKHALHSMLGAGSPPEGVETMSPMEAVIRVVDDLVAQMLRDLKAEGLF